MNGIDLYNLYWCQHLRSLYIRRNSAEILIEIKTLLWFQQPWLDMLLEVCIKIEDITFSMYFVGIDSYWICSFWQWVLIKIYNLAS